MDLITFRGLLTILISVLLILSIGPKSCADAQTQSDPEIHFVLPNGFVGAFKLVLDRETGVDMKLKNGRYTLEIPNNGVLKINSFKTFRSITSNNCRLQKRKANFIRSVRVIEAQISRLSACVDNYWRHR